MKRVICGIILLSLTLTFALGVRLSYGQNDTRVSVTPSAITIQAGQEVTINITVTRIPWPGLYCYELKVFYNNIVLEAVNTEIPSDHMLKPSLKAGNIFIVDSGTINQTMGFVSFALTLLGDEPGKTGNGTLVTVTFIGLSRGNSIIDLRDLILVNSDAIEIPNTDYTVEVGSVTVDGTTLPGDVNSDGKVNVLDITLAARSFGSKPGHPRWNPFADVNRDGAVNIMDLAYIAAHWKP